MNISRIHSQMITIKKIHMKEIKMLMDLLDSMIKLNISLQNQQ